MIQDAEPAPEPPPPGSFILTLTFAAPVTEAWRNVRLSVVGLPRWAHELRPHARRRLTDALREAASTGSVLAVMEVADPDVYAAIEAARGSAKHWRLLARERGWDLRDEAEPDALLTALFIRAALDHLIEVGYPRLGKAGKVQRRGFQQPLHPERRQEIARRHGRLDPDELHELTRAGLWQGLAETRAETIADALRLLPAAVARFVAGSFARPGNTVTLDDAPELSDAGASERASDTMLDRPLFWARLKHYFDTNPDLQRPLTGTFTPWDYVQLLARRPDPEVLRAKYGRADAVHLWVADEWQLTHENARRLLMVLRQLVAKQNASRPSLQLLLQALRDPE